MLTQDFFEETIKEVFAASETPDAALEKIGWEWADRQNFNAANEELFGHLIEDGIDASLVYAGIVAGLGLAHKIQERNEA